MLLRYFSKALLSNKRLWTLGTLWMLLWLFLSAFLFVKESSSTSLVNAIGTNYGYIVLASLSSMSVTIAATILYSGASLANGFRYTRLSPTSYVSVMLESSAITSIVFGVLQLVAIYVVFSVRFGRSLPPDDPVSGLLLSMLAGAFMLMLGMLLALVAMNYTGLQSQGFLSIIPFMLVILLGLPQAFTALPTELIYASPINAAESLLFAAYSGGAPHALLGDPTSAALQWPYLLISVVLWVVALFLLNTVLLRKLRPRNIEEARPM